MLKTTGCGLFGGEVILGKISFCDVAVHGTNDIKQGLLKKATFKKLTCEGTVHFMIIFQQPLENSTHHSK